MNFRGAPALASALLVLGPFVGAPGCSGTKNDAGEPEPQGEGPADSASTPEVLELGPVTKTSLREHPAGVAWVFDGDPSAPTKMDIGQAEARGYTIVDLSNGWVPYIFSEKTPGQDDATPNAHRSNYIALANDEIDEDGEALEPHQHNYLELYGIPPSLAVVFAEWQRLDQEVLPCLAEAQFDPAVLKAYLDDYDGVIAYRNMTDRRRQRARVRTRTKLAKAMRRAGLDPDSQLGREKASEHPKLGLLHAAWNQVEREVAVIAEAQKRLACERLFVGNEGRGSFEPGVFDSQTTHALALFEKKHDLMGWGHFNKSNLAELAAPPEQGVHRRLLRVIEDRVATSASIVEDGSAEQWRKDFRWRDRDGNEHALRDLVSEFSDATIAALGVQELQSARDQLALLSDLGEGNFADLLVAVKTPPRPEYYSDEMELHAVIDRGDVWYDMPFDERGRRREQKRRRFPHLTLYVNYLDQDIPLVHWRTTIGSWRNELIEGQVMLRYKNSDVGPRVWKDIVSAPVWIPPTSTPPKALLKKRRRRGQVTTVVSYDKVGPGYGSAYGLVAAYHIQQKKDEAGNVIKEYDNAIRTHGSVDYMSILRRYSHGCHRLYNMNAVRMFSFILQHREYLRKGEQRLGLKRPFDWEGEEYVLEIDSRGYKYELVDPVPVMVTEGRIRGRRKRPYSDYVPKPVPPEEAEEMLEDIEDALGGFLSNNPLAGDGSDSDAP